MTDPDPGLQELSGLLWHERQVLDHLAYRLTVGQLLVRAGHVEWLVRATGEVDGVLDDLRIAELSRVAAWAGLTELLALTEVTPLRALADRLAEPWPEIFLAHRQALAALLAGVGRKATELRDLLEARCPAAVHDRPAPGSLPGRAGESGGPGALDVLVEQLDVVVEGLAARRALAATAGVVQQGLADFLA